MTRILIIVENAMNLFGEKAEVENLARGFAMGLEFRGLADFRVWSIKYDEL
jgi:hypothetical protein